MKDRQTNRQIYCVGNCKTRNKKKFRQKAVERAEGRTDGGGMVKTEINK